MEYLELKINLANREAIEAAIPLLQTILGGVCPARSEFTGEQLRAAHEAGGTHTHIHVPAGSEASVVGNVAHVAPFPTPTLVPAQAEQPAAQDAAAVFGANPFALPTAVPSTAGATAFPSAPEVPPGGAPMPTPAAFPSAPPTGLVAPVPTAGAMVVSPANGVNLDSTGLPWDARIHAGSKSKNKDGSWTAKRGLNDEASVNAIKAELRALMAASPGAALPGPLTPATTPMPPMPGAVPFVPPVVNSPPAQPVVPSEPASPPETFDQLMLRMVPFIQSGAVPPNAVVIAAEAHKLPSLTSLQQNPSYVPYVWRYLQQQYSSVK